MKVENAKMVSVHYTLTVDGQVADQSREGQPLQFICGTGMLLPKFEGAIMGKEPGEKVSFTLAHRLMDYGFHAPTLSFPVHETLMVEPTESEPKAEMDRFMEALVQIKRECEAAAASGQKDNVVVNAPHTAVELAGEWAHPYSRMEAAFPLEWVKCSKFFPYVTKIDNGYGDRNLVCCNMD